MTDYDAIVIGAGHNGLVCATYLARAGLQTLLVEARSAVGGCASTVDALGARVNICNCDHITFRTTPVMEELRLADHGLRYLDVEPGAMFVSWDGSPAWPIFHDVERTLEGLRLTHPDEVEGYRRYAQAAVPAAATDPRRRGRAAVDAIAGRQGDRPPRGRSGDRAALEQDERGRRGAPLLPLRGAARPRAGARAGRVGDVAGGPGDGVGGAHLRPAPRRRGRAPDRRQRHGADGAARGVRGQRGEGAHELARDGDQLRGHRRVPASSSATAARSRPGRWCRRATRTARSCPGCATLQRAPGR